MSRELENVDLTQQGSEAWEQERVERLNADIAGEADGYDCAECKNRRYFWGRKNGYTVTMPCKCVDTRRARRRIEKSGLSHLLSECTLENFRTDTVWQHSMKEKALAFLDDHRGKWFCALGVVGGGKTHICTAMCGKFLERGQDVRYMMWLDEVVKIKAVAMDDEARSRLVEPLKRASVLYIDDLFKSERNGTISAADIKLAFEILNHRYINRDLVTIISSERYIEDICDIDEAVGSRIYQRTKEHVVELVGADKNYRYKSP